MKSKCVRVFVLTAAFFALAPGVRSADGVALTVTKGPLAGDLTLDWTGGQPTFDVYRAATAAGLVAPGNLVTSTSDRTLTTGQGPDTISFFLIASPCVIDLPERCDGADNDCNGEIDEAGAESSCELANATASCVAGACAIDTCDGGYADCDVTAANGCEIATSDFDTDPSNCGGCGIACPSGPNAAAQCAASMCGLVCNPDFVDCNVNPVDGCEVNTTSDIDNCGNCSNVCPSHPMSTRTCITSACSYTCNGTFVDCDGLPGNGCEVQANSFPFNSLNCGGCGNVCTVPNGIGVCSASTCQSTISSCNAGYVDVDENAANGCEYQCTATGADLPDDAFVDANCDGIDGTASAAVFVSPSGNDANPGTKAQPRLTINSAIALALATAKTQVYVDQGVYNGTVTLVNGISLYGGYWGAAGWLRGATLVSEIRGTTPSAGTLRGVTGSSITSPTTLDRLRITTVNAPAGPVSTYALYCSNCHAIVVKNCTLIAGSGSAGANGTAGTAGANGGNGFNGAPGACDANVSATGGNAGVSTCSRAGGAGGAGHYSSVNGSPGAPGVGPTSGGGGGAWGDPGGFGSNGVNGATGSNGADGLGGSGFSIPGGFWVGSGGGNGLDGTPGNGGGGGGGGGGNDCFFCIDGTGNGGGGGAAGGCAGTGATGGTAGGGSFGVFFHNTTGFTLTNSSIYSGDGGAGGDGFAGGAGSTGGTGGAGATTCTAQVGRGGNGGNGGAGGAGGASGGGLGGFSFAVYRVASVGTISGCTLDPGTGGDGGNGGTPSNAGSAGASGTLF